MDTHLVSWKSLWAPFLEEAVEATIRASKERHRELSASASAIILSRTSWEAFSNELIEQRSIDRGVKELSTADKLKKIHHALLGQTVAAHKDPLWSNLLLVTAIRNSAVHSESRSRNRSESPRNIAQKLSSRGIISIQNTEWEDQVFCARVAKWSCHQIGTAITELEAIPARQFRPTELILHQIRRILAPLQENQIV